MSRKFIYIGMILGGWAGWWVGDRVGLGIMGAFLTSSVGSFAGLFGAWWLTQNYLE